jgi:hypothetical protein
VERKNLFRSVRVAIGRGAMNGKIFREFVVPQGLTCRTRLSSSGYPNYPLTMRFVSFEPKLLANYTPPCFLFDQ